jgi:tRNA-2-methylthio-N6-dimethylallyladenosine synthase
MNFHDSERMAGLLEQAGYESADSQDEADLIVVNTCSVRELAEEKLFSRLGKLRKNDPEGRQTVAVTGCVAQQEGKEILRRAPNVDVVVGTQALQQLPMLVEQSLKNEQAQVDINPYEDVSFPLGVARRNDPVKAYVNIVEGCNDFCAFCVVPYTRGHERMRSSAEILGEINEAVQNGRREIHLLGQIVNHYQAPDDSGCDFAELLARVQEINGVDRIRFASPHPRHVTPRMIGAIRDLPSVCKHLHLPVQSGSTRILSDMRRRYTREIYLELVQQIREAVPGIGISTDVIVGFPGESEEDFQETLSLTSLVRFNSMFSFKYSERPFTKTAKSLPDTVSAQTKTERIVELQALQGDIQYKINQDLIGAVEEVLVDGSSRKRATELCGRTTGNTVVNFPGDASLLGATVAVRIRRAGPHSVRGEIVNAEKA